MHIVYLMFYCEHVTFISRFRIPVGWILGFDYYAGSMAIIVGFIYHLVKTMILFDRSIDFPCCIEVDTSPTN